MFALVVQALCVKTHTLVRVVKSSKSAKELEGQRRLTPVHTNVAIDNYWLAALVTAGAGFANFVGSMGMFARNSLNATVERPSVQVTTQ